MRVVHVRRRQVDWVVLLEHHAAQNVMGENETAAPHITWRKPRASWPDLATFVRGAGSSILVTCKEDG